MWAPAVLRLGSGSFSLEIRSIFVCPRLGWRCFHENLHAPCAVFHCDSPIVALHLVQCQGSIVQPRGLHFRGSLPPLRGFPLQIFHCDGPSLHFRGSLPPLRGFHFKPSIVTVPLLHCTLCSVKVPLSSRQV